MNFEETEESCCLVETEISTSKRYCFPNEIVIQKHDGVYLAIYTEGIMWLVLADEQELAIFMMLQDGHCIKEAMDIYDEDAIANVVAQVEAKRFDSPLVNERTERRIYILLTNRCNQRCRHCYMFAGDVEYDELSCEQWMRVLADFRNHGGDGVTFTGGEVTVYEGYDRVIKYAHNLGLSVTVLSNGILWSEEAIGGIHDSIDEVQVSVDGYDPDSYRSVRRSDGFNSAITCIKRFYEAGTKVSMAVTPLYEDLDAFVEGFERFARDFLRQYPDIFIKLNLELIDGREISISKEKNTEYKKKLRQLVERLYPEYYTETFFLNYEDHVVKRNCGFGEISIASNGDVYWCNRISELKKAANVLDTSFQTIMVMSEKVMRHTSVDNTAECTDCDIRYICGGGCRLEYDGILNACLYSEEVSFRCHGKDDMYTKMILGNEYFFE